MDPRWQSEENAKIPPDTLCSAVGYFLKQTREELIISPNRGPEGVRDQNTIKRRTIEKIIVKRTHKVAWRRKRAII